MAIFHGFFLMFARPGNTSINFAIPDGLISWDRKSGSPGHRQAVNVWFLRELLWAFENDLEALQVASETWRAGRGFYLAAHPPNRGI